MKATIRKSKIGKGIFATRDIKKNELIFMFCGRVLRERTYESHLNCDLQIGQKKYIYPFPASFGRFTNHSCNPNAGLKGKQKIVAITNIKSGEEITLDYSTTTSDVKWKMSCKCGSKKCRKIIRSIQYLPEDVFKKHKAFIPKFLQKVRIQG